MSKDLHNNERYLKELADGHKPVPPPMVWDEIEQVLDKDKGKRRLFPMVWIFGALLMGAMVFINIKGEKDKRITTVDQETITSDDQIQSDPNPKTIRTGDSEAVNELKQGQTANISERNISEYQKQSDSNPKTIRTGDSEAVNELKQGQTANISERNISEYQKQNDPNPKTIRTVDSENIEKLVQGQTANIAETIPPVFDNSKGKKVDSEKLKSFVTQKEQSNLLSKSAADSSVKANTNTINSNVTAKIAKEDIFSPGNFTESTELALEDRHIIQVTALPRLEWKPIPFETGLPLTDLCENLTTSLSFESRGDASLALATPWFVEFGGGIGRNLSNSELTDPTQGGFRLATESRWYSWSTSFQLGYQFDNLWYTTIGFDLNQTKNKFDFWRRDISSLIVSENQSLQITNGDFFNIGETRYTFADVGLSIGRRVNIDKWHFSLEGGPIFNVLFNANGKLQVGDLEFSRLEDQEEYFNTQIGIGTRLSAMLDYPISDQLWISVGPTYHQYFNSVSSDENPLKERNSILQVKAKVRYHF